MGRRVLTMVNNKKATSVLLGLFILIALTLSQYYLSIFLHNQQQKLLEQKRQVVCQFFTGHCNALPYRPELGHAPHSSTPNRVNLPQESSQAELTGKINELFQIFLDDNQLSLKKEPPSDPNTLYLPIDHTDLYLTKKLALSNLQTILISPLFLVAVFLSLFTILAGALHGRSFSFRSQKGSLPHQREQSEELQKEIHKRQETEKELNYKVNFDATTQLPNKKMAHTILCARIAEAQKTDQRLYVLSIDLANFKKVNKGLGHDGGEHLLEIAAKRIVQASGTGSTVARLRGDEFLVCNIEDSETSSLGEDTAKNILEELQKPFFVQQIDFYLGACIGISFYPRDSSEADKLMRYADLAMYRAKEKGHNMLCFYNESLSHIISRKQMLEQHLHKAISRDELTLYYQPFIKLGKELKIVGAEALLRWNNTTFKDITTPELIAIAEETGLIVPIGEWVIHKATADIASINPPKSFRIALNLSAQQFHNPIQLQTAIVTALKESGLEPEQLEMEITENNLLNLGTKTITLLEWIKQLGIRLSIDDFGTGYSSLHYLQKHNFDLLKIDKSFIKNIHLKKSNRALVGAIFAMSKALGIEVIAEGIESKEEEEFLYQQNYGLAQGFRYSKPLPLEQFALLIDQQNKRGYVRFSSNKKGPAQQHP